VRIKFELYDFIVQLKITFLSEFSFEIAPVTLRYAAACEDLNNIDNRHHSPSWRIFLIWFPSKTATLAISISVINTPLQKIKSEIINGLQTILPQQE